MVLLRIPPQFPKNDVSSVYYINQIHTYVYVHILTKLLRHTLKKSTPIQQLNFFEHSWLCSCNSTSRTYREQFFFSFCCVRLNIKMFDIIVVLMCFLNAVSLKKDSFFFAKVKFVLNWKSSSLVEQPAQVFWVLQQRQTVPFHIENVCYSAHNQLFTQKWTTL